MEHDILIIDDNQKLCESLIRSFAKRDMRGRYATNSSEAFALLRRHACEVVLLDVMLGAENGIEILKRLLSEHPGLHVIMITAYGSIETAVEAIKIGAFDYIEKPVKFEKLLQVVNNAFTISRLDHENRQLKARMVTVASNIITQDAAMRAILEKLKKFAPSDLSILLQGESGTGKELMAEYLHANSGFAHKAMQSINCAAFPESLLDNELFGHEKGAFTGADSVYRGVFERAHNNTLFLDEIGDMPLALQAKILRTIQNREIRRLGGQERISVNVRFIAATNKSLATLVDQGLFREDLYYRLNAGMFRVPPLRERKDDIPLLIEHFMAACQGNRAAQPLAIAPSALEALLRYEWPGNVRELRNAIHYACTAASDGRIHCDDLPAPLTSKPGFSSLQQSEKDVITRVLRQVNFNKRRAAAMLNISRTTLYAKIKQYEISAAKPTE